jgi:4-hydroxy-tetrahydrodipicolinate synthase
MATVPAQKVVVVTPFAENGALDEAALERIVDRLAAFGFGLYLGSFGSGEGHLLRPAEISRMYRVAVDVAGSRAPVYAAALGFTGTDLVLELAHEARDLGVAAIQLMPPRPGPPTVEPPAREVEQYYRDFLDAYDGDVHLTNEYFMVGYSVPADLMTALCTEYSQITSINATHPDVGHLADLTGALGDRVPVHVGLLAQLPTALSLGAAGPLGFEASIAPELSIQMLESYQRNDLVAFNACYRMLLRLHRTLMLARNPRSLKAALNLIGVPAGLARRPYLPLASGEVDTIRAVISQLGLLDS